MRIMSIMTSALARVKEKVSFTFPVLIVVALSSILVWTALLSTIQIEAVVFEAEPGAGPPVWQGILNAAIFIVPAVLFAFVIAYMVKKKKMNFLKVFFLSALFLTTSIITFFFILLLDDLIWSRIGYLPYDYELATFVWDVPASLIGIFGEELPFYLYGPLPGISAGSAMAFSGFMGILLAGTVFSKKMKRTEKNQALLLIGALMGSFLSFILPWWTVVPMLLGLVVYDIYAVFKGPIKAIHEESEVEYEKGLKEAWEKRDREEDLLRGEPADSGKNVKTKGTSEVDRRERLLSEYRAKAAEESQRKNLKKQKGLLGKFSAGDSGDFSEDLLSSMTYGTDEWELGIGDLVFYGMLGSHTLMIGTALIPKFGIFAPWIFFATTLVGIIIGFFITLKLLERGKLLPGLPIPIVLGLSFMGLTYLGFYIFL